MTGGPGSGERLRDGGEGNEFPRRSRRHRRTSGDEHHDQFADAPSPRPYWAGPTGSHAAQPYPTGSHAYPTGSHPDASAQPLGSDALSTPEPAWPPAAGRHPLAYGAEPRQDDTGAWHHVVDEARAAQSDQSGPWPTRVSGLTALGAVALVVLVAVLAVVGLPRFLSSSADSDVYHSTTLHLPTAIEGLPRVGGDKVTPEDKRSAQQLLTAVRFPLQTAIGVYARPTGVRLTVVTGRPAKPIPEADIASLRDGFTAGMKAADVQVQEIGPGELGGWFGCARLEHGQTLCLAMDAGALVSISVTSNDPSAITLAAAARGAVEHRTPDS